MRDEGRLRKAWPLGVGYQEQASNRFKLLRSRVVVVSVGVKHWIHLVQVWSREMSESEPSSTRRKVEIDVETRCA